MKRLFILILILVFPLLLLSKIVEFDYIGEIGIKWAEYENPLDKTHTIIRSNGRADYDDHNGFVTSDIKLGIEAHISRMVKAGLEFEKRDTLWATHDNNFTPEKYQTLGSLFGAADPTVDNVWNGIKLTKAYLEIGNVMNFMNFRFGRQYITGSIYPEDLEKDLVLNATLDAIRADLRFNYFDIMGFFAKLNDDAAKKYEVPLIWEAHNKYASHHYQDGDFDLYGLYFYFSRINENFEPRIYFVNGILHDPNVTNPEGKVKSNYDNKKIIGTKLKFYFIDSLLKINTEFAYQFGEKYVGQYKYLDDDTLTVKIGDFYDKSEYNAYIFDLNASFKSYISEGCFLKFIGEFVTGSGDDSKTPEEDTGFRGFNDMFLGHKVSYEMRGWGAIVKANPYTPVVFAPNNANFVNGYLEDPNDARTIDQTYSIFPTQIFNLGLELGIDNSSVLKGTTFGIYYFNFMNLSKDGAVYLNENNERKRTFYIGQEIDFKISYEFENRNALFSLTYGIFLPGETYMWGKDHISGKIIGQDPVTLFAFEVKMFFY